MAIERVLYSAPKDNALGAMAIGATFTVQPNDSASDAMAIESIGCDGYCARPLQCRLRARIGCDLYGTQGRLGVGKGTNLTGHGRCERSHARLSITHYASMRTEQIKLIGKTDPSATKR